MEEEIFVDKEDKVLYLDDMEVTADFKAGKLLFRGEETVWCDLLDAEKLGEWLLDLWE